VLRHVVCFKWNDDATSGQIHDAERGLRSLPDQIAEIQRYELGADAGLSDDTYDMVLLAEFDDDADFRRYTSHPQHRLVVDAMISPILSSIVRVQTWIG
jgi:hypothetical protein